MMVLSFLYFCNIASIVEISCLWGIESGEVKGEPLADSMQLLDYRLYIYILSYLLIIMCFLSLDEDECITQKPCPHICHNVVGTYYCSCPKGLTISADGRACQGKHHFLKSLGGQSVSTKSRWDQGIASPEWGTTITSPVQFYYLISNFLLLLIRELGTQKQWWRVKEP